MNIVLYLSIDKSREIEIGEALGDGFRHHGDRYDVVATAKYDGIRDDTQMAVIVGIKGSSRRIYDDHRRAGLHVLLVDKSYFSRGEYCRISLDGFQPHYAHDIPRSGERFDLLRIKLLPRRERGEHLIYAGSSQKYCDWHGLGDASIFAESVCHAVNKRTGGQRPLYYRPKPSWAAGHADDVHSVPGTIFSGPDEYLSQRLDNCHALITHGSNAAIEAIAAGVPVVLLSHEGVSAVFPLAEKNIDNLDAPFFPDNDARRRIFNNLAWCQFTLKDMRRGLAWETLHPYTIKGAALSRANTQAERVIALYKIMHRGNKMYRGGSLKGHWEAIAALVQRHGAKSLLDYGSGKGRQYDELGLHERWGGIRPHCYDPGYEPFAEKPIGAFDGVICTDVAEHVLESDVDDFLRDVVGYSRQFVFFCIFTRPSRKRLPDGRNCHLTVRPAQWWLERICTAIGGHMVEDMLIRKGEVDDPHFVIHSDHGAEVVVTFRGGE